MFAKFIGPITLYADALVAVLVVGNRGGRFAFSVSWGRKTHRLVILRGTSILGRGA